ncbi:MAG: isoprenyl transferase [Bacteroidetes bacterium]|nr:MAG: isoprenyl transferase [Bacteroidota bacterium]
MQDVPTTITAPEATDRAAQAALKQRGELPAHIAIIMDGNGRWARERGKSRVVGHHEGVESVRDITEACAQLGVPYLTLYTFSTENWQRPPEEVNALMSLLVHSIERERETLLRNNIQLRVLGDVQQLPGPCQTALQATIEVTAANTGLVLSLALSYSGRWEILQAVRRLARAVQEGRLAVEDIGEDVFAATLATAGMPDPDLLIRTGGEQRISNFLLWQIAYTELYVTDEYWPAFRRAQLYEAIRSFQDRDRRFGRVEA